MNLLHQVAHEKGPVLQSACFLEQCHPSNTEESVVVNLSMMLIVPDEDGEHLAQGYNLHPGLARVDSELIK